MPLVRITSTPVAEFVRLLTQAKAVAKFKDVQRRSAIGGTLTRFRYILAFNKKEDQNCTTETRSTQRISIDFSVLSVSPW